MKGLSQPGRPTSTGRRDAARTTADPSRGPEVTEARPHVLPARFLLCRLSRPAREELRVAHSMRTPIVTAAVLLPLLVAMPVRADEGPRLLRCQQRIATAAARFGAQRRNALMACVERALRCPAALTGTATAAD